MTLTTQDVFVLASGQTLGAGRVHKFQIAREEIFQLARSMIEIIREFGLKDSLVSGTSSFSALFFGTSKQFFKYEIAVKDMILAS